MVNYLYKVPVDPIIILIFDSIILQYVNHMYSNYSVCKHIEEGICLPVNVRLVLTRNVTIRHTRH